MDPGRGLGGKKGAREVRGTYSPGSMSPPPFLLLHRYPATVNAPRRRTARRLAARRTPAAREVPRSIERGVSAERARLGTSIVALHAESCRAAVARTRSYTDVRAAVRATPRSSWACGVTRAERSQTLRVQAARSLYHIPISIPPCMTCRARSSVLYLHGGTASKCGFSLPPRTTCASVLMPPPSFFVYITLFHAIVKHCTH